MRQYLIRRRCRVQDLAANGIEIRIARTSRELEGAFRLLHESYVQVGFTERQASGMRCTLFQAFPHTTIVIAWQRGKGVIGTVSLIKDTSLGLPADADYREEDDLYREQGKRLVEIVSLTVDPAFRSLGHSLSLGLMKFVLLYAKNFMRTDLVVAVTRPSARDFYQAIFGATQNGPVRMDSFVHKPVVHMTIDFADLLQNILPNFPRRADGSDVGSYMSLNEDPAIRLPVRKHPLLVDPVMNPRLIDRFFNQATDTLLQASERDLSLLRSAYDQLTGIDWVPHLTQPAGRFSYRFCSFLPARLSARAEEVDTTVLDLSAGGMYVELGCDLPLREPCMIRFESEGRRFVFKAEPVWRQEGRRSFRPPGYGMRVLEGQEQLRELLKKAFLPEEGA